MPEKAIKPDPDALPHKMRQTRHKNGRDLKVIVTQRNSGTGMGKTTLAVYLALCWDEHGWNGYEKGTLEPEEFLSTYPELPAHSVLIMDESEALDNRRSMQQENIDFSKHWMTMRTRQIDSILTLPTIGALDKRLWELADLRLHVVEPGKAKVNRITVDDHNPLDGVDEWDEEDFTWPDLSDHPQFKLLDKQKQAKIDAAGEDDEEDDEEIDASEVKKYAYKRARELRREGASVNDIRESVANNPQDDTPWAHETIRQWTKDCVPDDEDKLTSRQRKMLDKND